MLNQLINHGTLKRKQNYFSRHSGEKTKNKPLLKNGKKSKGCYNSKKLSHIYFIFLYKCRRKTTLIEVHGNTNSPEPETKHSEAGYQKKKC